MGESRVLIVEDQPTQRELLRAFLEFHGHVVGEAHSGEDALAMLDSFEPDLLITDLVMTGMGGLELIRRIRSTRNWADLPVILCSASEELRIGPLPEDGSVRILPKPYSGDRLAELVRSAASGPRPGARGSARAGERESSDGEA